MLLPLLQTQKTAGRRALITQLNEVLEDKFVNARLGIAKKRVKCVRDRVRALEALFTRLKRISDPSAETAEVQEVLGEIVKEAHEITMGSSTWIFRNAPHVVSLAAQTSLEEIE